MANAIPYLIFGFLFIFILAIVVFCLMTGCARTKRQKDGFRNYLIHESTPTSRFILVLSTIGFIFLSILAAIYLRPTGY